MFSMHKHRWQNNLVQNDKTVLLFLSGPACLKCLITEPFPCDGRVKVMMGRTRQTRPIPAATSAPGAPSWGASPNARLASAFLLLHLLLLPFVWPGRCKSHSPPEYEVQGVLTLITGNRVTPDQTDHSTGQVVLRLPRKPDAGDFLSHLDVFGTFVGVTLFRTMAPMCRIRSGHPIGSYTWLKAVSFTCDVSCWPSSWGQTLDLHTVSSKMRKVKNKVLYIF